MAKLSINLQKGTIEKEQKGDVIVGIDLGTTNSLVAYMKEGQPKAVREGDGAHTLVPSVIHFGESVEVGDTAKEKLLTAPERTIYSVKRLMGKSYKDVAEVQNYFGYTIIDEDEDKLVKVRVEDRFYTPIELSAEILKQLKERVEKALEQKVSKAVITVPAYFNDAQRQATRDAGKLAGLEVLRIVNEPTAASLAYGIGTDQSERKTIAVYDLGGGTFDISLLQIEGGIFEVLSTNGDTFLGGDDFDRLIIDHWVKEQGIDAGRLERDKGFAQAIRLLAEEAKKALSTEPQFEAQLESYALRLDAATFSGLSQDLLSKTLDACRNALKDADLQAKDIDEVVLVGGSTRMPIVKKAVADFFQRPINDSLNPDEVVALGAAVQADILAGNNKDFLLLDITPLSLGIETVGGLMDVIIPRNSKVPARVGRQYTTSVDGQKNLKVAVYQGERDLVQDNRQLGEFVLRGIPPMPAGLPKIEIHFILNADGILQVKAKELRSGVEQQIELRPSYGVSEEEMALMLKDSIQNAQEDMQKRALIEAKTEAKSVLQAAEKFIQQHQAIFEDQELLRFRELLEVLMEKVKGTDKDAIHKAMDELNSYSQPFAHRAMDQTISQAMQGTKL